MWPLTEPPHTGNQCSEQYGARREPARLAALLALGCTFAQATAFSTDATDLWWNPNESGWGINFNHQGDILFGTLFTYDSSGRDYWLVAPDLRRQSDGSFAGSLMERCCNTLRSPIASHVGTYQRTTNELLFQRA